MLADYGFDQRGVYETLLTSIPLVEDLQKDGLSWTLTNSPMRPMVSAVLARILPPLLHGTSQSERSRVSLSTPKNDRPEFGFENFEVELREK